MAGNARKERMNARRERLQAVLFWTLLALDFDAETANAVAERQVRNALPFAKWVGELSGYSYMDGRFE